MMERTLAKRYAAALLRMTDQDGSTEETESFLLALKAVYEKDRPFRQLLASPKVPRKVKKQVLRKAFEGRAKPSFLDFLELLVDKNRLKIIPDVADMFDRLADASKGLVRIKVRTWRPLTDSLRSRLHDKLTTLTGKQILIEDKADSALLGGMSVQVGDSIIDGTVVHRLKTIGERFRELQRR